MQTRRFLALVLVAWCKPYDAYVPVTSATISSRSTPAATAREWDASGELPSTAEPANASSPMYGSLPFFPFFPVFPIPQLDVGRGYAPVTQPVAPAYGPGGGPR